MAKAFEHFTEAERTELGRTLAERVGKIVPKTTAGGRAGFVILVVPAEADGRVLYSGNIPPGEAVAVLKEAVALFEAGEYDPVREYPL